MYLEKVYEFYSRYTPNNIADTFEVSSNMINPDKFDLVSSFKITKGSGPHWSHPYIAHGNIYLRHGSVLMAYKID